jgi:hypothetical protein
MFGDWIVGVGRGRKERGTMKIMMENLDSAT